MCKKQQQNLVSDSVYFAGVERFSNSTNCCRDNSLDLNIKKTKETLIDFRKNQTVIPDLFIDGLKVKRVTEYKYLGTVLNNKLNFNKNTDFIHERCQPRTFCLQKLRFLNVSAAVLHTFYWSCIESVLTFSFLCWFGGLNVKRQKVLNKVVNVCGKVVGERQEQLSQLYKYHVVQKATVG